MIDHPHFLEHISNVTLDQQASLTCPCRCEQLWAFSQHFSHFPSEWILMNIKKLHLAILHIASFKGASSFPPNLTVLQLVEAMKTVGKCFLFSHYESPQARASDCRTGLLLPSQRHSHHGWNDITRGSLSTQYDFHDAQTHYVQVI